MKLVGFLFILMGVLAVLKILGLITISWLTVIIIPYVITILILLGWIIIFWFIDTKRRER